MIFYKIKLKNMKKFKIVIDVKCIVFDKVVLEVQSEAMKDAEKMAKDFIENSNDYDGKVIHNSSEYIKDREQILTPEENYCLRNFSLFVKSFKDIDNAYSALRFIEDESFEIKKEI